MVRVASPALACADVMVVNAGLLHLFPFSEGKHNNKAILVRRIFCRYYAEVID